MAHKVGDKVRITKEINGHEFNIGEIIMIEAVDINSDGHVEYFSRDSLRLRYGWYFLDEECEAVNE